MQYTIQHKRQSTDPDKQWLRRIYTTGFVFFLVKGLAWVVATVWVIF